MRPAEIINARIEALNEGLNPAVRRAGGAQFALMLSMIAESQQLARRVAADEAVADTGAPGRRDDLYTPQLVGELGRALRSGQLGDLHLAISWLETAPLAGRRKPAAAPEPPEGVPLAQAAVLAKRYTLLDEINESRRRIAA